MSPTPTKTKPKPTPKAKAVSAETLDSLETVQAVVAIPLDKLHRHPLNREIPPTSVEDLIESLREHGQREPLRVRPLADPIGHFEILSGERRFVAAGQIPEFESLRCIVETHSTPQSLIELAVANAARQDLNHIERAELLERLIADESAGGAGMERLAAGRPFGLNSESGVKNALRLLKLPAKIRALVASGKVPIAKARPLCAYPDELLEAFATWLHDPKSPHRLKNFCTPVIEGEEGDEEIDNFVFNYLRPADKVVKYRLDYQLGGEQPALFELTDELRKKMQVVEIPYAGPRWGKPSKDTPKTRLVALNVKAWEREQIPLAKAAVKAAIENKSKSPKGSSKPEPKKPPTPAELKARRKKADGQLAEFTGYWIREAIRFAISEQEIETNVAVWLLGKFQDSQRMGSPRTCDFLEWAVCETGNLIQDASNPQRLAALGKWSFAESAAKLALWPVATHAKSHGDLVAPGELPDILPPLGREVVDDLAAALGVTIKSVWTSARSTAIGGSARGMVARWLGRHTKDQLTDLAAELGVDLTASKRDEMVDELLAAHGPSKPLKLPALLAKFDEKPAKAVAKKGGRK
jgi:ParB family transcriptional regulator, chromosome partitioning protein